MQGLGTLLCAVVLVVLTRSLGENYDAQWRLALLFGAFPMAAAFFLRYDGFAPPDKGHTHFADTAMQMENGGQRAGTHRAGSGTTSFRYVSLTTTGAFLLPTFLNSRTSATAQKAV
jgi:uncharacterized membrane protein